MPSRCLDAQILTVFKRAIADDRPDVADHLLRALETLCPDEMLGSWLAQAYVTVATGGSARDATAVGVTSHGAACPSYMNVIGRGPRA